MQFPTLLAIDFGTKRVGLAISRGTLAEPLCILTQSPAVIHEIKQICKQESVAKIIVGISENEMAEKTRVFATLLEQQIKLPLEFMDETLSSHTVHTKLKELGASLKKRQEHVDALAAAEFLQEYLDTQD